MTNAIGKILKNEKLVRDIIKIIVAILLILLGYNLPKQ